MKTKTICHAASPKNNSWPTLIFIVCWKCHVRGLGKCYLLMFATHHHVNHKVKCTRCPRGKQTGLENTTRCGIWVSDCSRLLLKCQFCYFFGSNLYKWSSAGYTDYWGSSQDARKWACLRDFHQDNNLAFATINIWHNHNTETNIARSDATRIFWTEVRLNCLAKLFKQQWQFP